MRKAREKHTKRDNTLTKSKTLLFRSLFRTDKLLFNENMNHKVSIFFLKTTEKWYRASIKLRNYYCGSNVHDDQNTTKHLEIWSIWKSNKIEGRKTKEKKTTWH